ncbi:conjugal transfer protein TraF [Mycetohabitans sp. B2]|uniref:conjugal transfer protein TraF n=1 Tax=Mycetohabitans sp. B2 TaxID=2841274 RepID=UPI001F1699FD|nr:conjugal transfer protein TraF [Mycetohabitans sp. B2]MCF7697089.1 conjugal transfer protein TraF [Mycetohabitans sp. B2]
MLKRTLLALVIVSGVAHAESVLDYPSVWKCDTDKFNWYCDMDEGPEKIQQPATQPVKPKRIELKDIKTAEQLRQELKRREDVAVMNPTEQNLKDYLELWQLTQNKGAVFADTWRRVVWQNPDFDYTLKRPANNSAIKVYDTARLRNEAQQLRRLAKDHGLIFFFSSHCSYCHAMAPTLKVLADKYGLDVLGVSLDGGGLPEFPNPRDGRAQAAAWGIERVPALFIGSKHTGDLAPIGFGMMALSEIVNRIFVLTATKPGDNF